MEPLPITPKTSDDLAVIADLTSQQLDELILGLTKNVKYFRSRDLVKTFEKAVGREASRPLLSHIASLNLLRDDNNSSAEEVFDALHAGIVDAVLPEIENKIVSIKRQLVSLIENESIYLSVKGTRLFAVDSSHLHEAKVYCDIRPIFGPARENIHAYLTFATLHLVASDEKEEETRTSIALGEKDLKHLVSECERALRKLEKIEDSMSQIDNVSIIRYGSD